MMDKNYWAVLFLFLLLYTTAFTEEKSVMWDFGVVINNSVQPIQHNGKNLSSPIKLTHVHSQDKALIADPFISPTLTSLTKTASDIPIFSEPCPNTFIRLPNIC